jgi:hypothetical protein
LAPNSRGSAITAYKVKLVQYDGISYAEETTQCEGSQSTVVEELSCAIPISTLKAAPYLLPWGSHVYAKIIATNAYGDSLESEAGDGAQILTVPDAPIGLSDVPSVTTST